MKAFSKASLVVGSGLLLVGFLIGALGFSPSATVGAVPQASSSPSDAPATSKTPSSAKIKPLDTSVPVGKAKVAKSAWSESEPPGGVDHSTQGAAGAFAGAAEWIVLSDLSRSDPSAAVRKLGDGLLNSADATVLTSMVRSKGDSFDVESGAYRVLGWSGQEAAPDQVMVDCRSGCECGGRD